jgi:hypothetical protein
MTTRPCRRTGITSSITSWTRHRASITSSITNWTRRRTSKVSRSAGQTEIARMAQECEDYAAAIPRVANDLG